MNDLNYDEALRALPAHARVTAARGRNAHVTASKLRETALQQTAIVDESVKILNAKYGVSPRLIANVLGISRTRVKQILIKFDIKPADTVRRRAAASKKRRSA